MDGAFHVSGLFDPDRGRGEIAELVIAVGKGCAEVVRPEREVHRYGVAGVKALGFGGELLSLPFNLVSAEGLPPCLELAHAEGARVGSGVDFLAAVIGDGLFLDRPRGCEAVGDGWSAGHFCRICDRGGVAFCIIANFKVVSLRQSPQRGVGCAVVGEYQSVVSVCVLWRKDLSVDENLNGVRLDGQCAIGRKSGNRECDEHKYGESACKER